MQIDFDPAKRNWTLENRGLDMARAQEIFDGIGFSFQDIRFPYGEQRFVRIGYLDARMVVLIWTKREEIVRIISLRKANAREQALYGPRLDRP